MIEDSKTLMSILHGSFTFNGLHPSKLLQPNERREKNKTSRRIELFQRSYVHPILAKGHSPWPLLATEDNAFDIFGIKKDSGCCSSTFDRCPMVGSNQPHLGCFVNLVNKVFIVMCH